MQACINYSHLSDFEILPTLFLEFHGSEASVSEQADMMRAITRGNDGGDFRWALKSEERTELWRARHSAYYAAKAMIPGGEAFSTDACVPISRLAECIAACQKMALDANVLAPIVGHVGDGNFHMLLVFDPNQAGARSRAEALSHAIARQAIDMGGTCTGEHGVGTHKQSLLVDEAGEAIATMQRIKAALDPKGIMNPGKILTPMR